MDKIISTVITVVVAVSASAALWIAANLLFNQALAPGSSASLSAEFFRPSLDPNFDPVFEIELLPFPETLESNPDLPRVDITRRETLPGGAYLIEIASIPGKRYAIEYSGDMKDWSRVPGSITAAANRLQWIDNCRFR